MSLKINLTSIIFVVLFIAQQIISYCFLEVNLFSPYWLTVFAVVLIVGIQMPLFSNVYKKEQKYLLLFILCSFLTVFNGYSIASCIAKAYFVLYAYIAYIYVVRHRIDTRVFGILLIILYIFFSSAYFLKLSYYGHGGEFEGELFGHSSSNTIPISLNTVLFFYLIIHEYNKENRYLVLMAFAVVNTILIYIQQSRAGIIVSLSLILVIFYLWQKSKRKSKFLLFTVVAFILGISIIVWFKMKDTIYLEDIGFESSLNETYSLDIRHFVQLAFFSNLDIKSFFLGYPPSSFFEGMGRTFNSFLDIWLKYGIIPFAYLIILLVMRIFKSKDFSISPVVIVPVFLYSMVESIYAGALWDMVWFFLIFLSYGHTSYSKSNSQH